MSGSQPQALLAPTLRSTYHGWKPHSNAAHNRFVLGIFEEAKGHVYDAQNPVDVFFDSLTKEQTDLFNDALVQVNIYYKEKWADPRSIEKSLDDIKKALRCIIQSAPKFYKAEIGGITIGEPIGVPIYLIFDLISNTSAAYTLFNQPSFNNGLKKLLATWGTFLTTPDSNKTLNSKDGWFSPPALEVLSAGLGRLTFFETYKTDSSEEPYYNSWDSFFTRELKNGVRPIDPPPQSSDIVYLYNVCESTVLRTITNVQLHDTFWGKAQNYSLYDILGKAGQSLLQSYAEQLVGSSAYQAFLSPADYHRWHSPLNGVIAEEPLVIPGTYYAALLDDGAPSGDSDLVPGDPHGALIRSQPWLSAAATRAVFIIKPTTTDSPVVPDAPFEVAALVAIGMAEVSTCTPTVKKGDKLKVGDQLGAFHFGGSSHVLFVKPKAGYRLVFQDKYETPIRPGQHRWINSVTGQFWRVATPL